MSFLNVNQINTAGGLTSYTTGANTIGFTSGTQTYTLGASSASTMKNRIINGDMRIDQRNAGGSTTPTTDTYNLDRWKYNRSTNNVSVQQNAGSVTPPPGFTKYLGLTVGTGATLGVSDYSYLQQIIEGYNVADLGFGTANAKTFTVSFWVRASIAGTYTLRASDGTDTYAYVTTYTITSSNTWQYVTVTIPGSTTGTWGTTNSVGLAINFGLACGSNWTAPSTNTWLNGWYPGLTSSVQFITTSGATFYITGVQLEVGSAATSFDYRHYGTELQLCQRYYQKSFGPAVVPANNTDSGRAILAIGGRMQVADVTGMRTGQITFINPMRAVPTITLYNSQSATGTAQFYTETGSSQDSTSFGPVVSSEIGFCGWQYTGVSVGTTGTLCQVLFHYTAVSEI